jgi:hypothetical protein
MAGAVVGDKVQLGYHVTPSSGLWNVLWKVEGN